VNGGARVHLFPEAGDKEYGMTGKLLFSDMTVDPTTGSITLRAEFPNPKRELLSGTFVRVKIEQGVDEKALTVPQRALIRSAQGASVLVVGADGKVAAVPVAPQAIGDRWVVTEGLKGGEKVIVEGLQKVRPGAPAKAVPFQNPQTGCAGIGAVLKASPKPATKPSPPSRRRPSKADHAHLGSQFHGEVFHRPAGVRVGARADHRAGRGRDPAAADRAVPQYRAADHHGQHHLPRCIGQDHRGHGGHADRAGAQRRAEPALLRVAE
jgi:hypothetical protein